MTSAPTGKLRIDGKGSATKKSCYYVRCDSKDKRGIYIKAKDIELARKLAQKDYDEKVLKAVEAELKAINLCKLHYPKMEAEQVYENISSRRKELVEPIKLSDDAYKKKWEEYIYVGKAFSEDMPELYTGKNERVRSKSEVIIADALNKAGVSYRYECPLELNGNIIVYPDFTILKMSTRENIYWEHLGMMDDKDYAESAIHKINLYIQNGICLGKNLILTFETKNRPINHKMISSAIKSNIY